MRLDNFPRLFPKDNVKLRELADLLMEILAAKGDAYLPGLAYLDTPQGINPIVDKLPTSLQEKWLFAGSRFKEENKVSFPPFTFFTHLICSEAKARNDPSFKLSNSSRAFTQSSDMKDPSINMVLAEFLCWCIRQRCLKIMSPI